MRPGSERDIGFVPRVSALYAAMSIVAGIQLPFFPLWLKAKGLDAATIGVVLAAPLLLRILTIPFVTREADRRDAVHAALVIASCASVAGYALVGLASGPAAILIAYALASLAITPLLPLAETYALRGLHQRGRAYGPVRLWGSATFILGNFSAGFAIDAIAPCHLIWMIAAASVTVIAAAIALPPLSSPTVENMPQGEHRALLRDPTFIAVLAAASLIQTSHAVYYGFSAVQWRSAGLDGTTIAGLWALGVIAEIVLFALQGRLPVFVTPTVLLMIGAVGGGLRWTAMALNPPVIALTFLQLLHALSFGATHLGTLSFISRHAPVAQSATAQGYYAIASGAVMAAGMALSGWLYASFGSHAYAAMALAAIVGGVCALVARWTGVAAA